jgi:hypothetical protein
MEGNRGIVNDAGVDGAVLFMLLLLLSTVSLRRSGLMSALVLLLVAVSLIYCEDHRR